MSNDKLEKYLKTGVFSILIFRLIIAWALPLLDKTEARYAEISRLMQETGEWVVLQVDYGFPFWAKPPLSTWLSAASFELFGVNELAARLPSFLLGLVLISILGYFVKGKKVSFYLPAFILLTTPEFLIHMGVVSTDSALCFSVALIMLSFWKSVTTNKKTIWNYLFFVGVGLGFLAKGPLVLVLTGPPIFLWLLLDRKSFFKNLGKLPWILGVLITVVIALPWYLIAEHRSPGFLDYFIVGEHFNRFLKSGWKGDLYGEPKSQPLGLIWAFMLLFALPWIYIVIAKLIKLKKKIFSDKWVAYLLFWLFWTPIFFTASSNILHTYILPSMIPLALLIVHWWPEYKYKKRALIISAIFPALAFLAASGALFTDSWKMYMNSDKFLVQKMEVLDNENNPPLFYYRNKSYSSQFYDGREVIESKLDTAIIDSMLQCHKKLYIISPNKKKNRFPEKYKRGLQLIDSNFKRTLFLYDRKNPEFR